MCAQLYVQRLGCQLQDVAAVRKVAGIAFALAMDALYDLPVLQFPPSLLAAALLFTARKTQVSRCSSLLQLSGLAILAPDARPLYANSRDDCWGNICCSSAVHDRQDRSPAF